MAKRKTRRKRTKTKTESVGAARDPRGATGVDPSLIASCFNTPLLITPQKAQIILGALSNRWNIAQLVIPGAAGAEIIPAASLQAMASVNVVAPSPPDWASYEAPEGIALIDVQGTLVHKRRALNPGSGMTGYDGVRVRFQQAIADPAVRAVVLDIDSGGGQVAGLFDLMDDIHAARGTKPVWAVLTETAYSAAYGIASQADRIIVPRTGGTGSIGVLTLHADFSGALDREGIKVTLIFAGAHKVDGNPFEALPEGVRAEVQGEIDRTYGMFTDLVARGRGVESARIRATEANIYNAPDSVEQNLADAVMSPMAAFKELSELVNRPSALAFGRPGSSAAAVDHIEPEAIAAGPSDGAAGAASNGNGTEDIMPDAIKPDTAQAGGTEIPAAAAPAVPAADTAAAPAAAAAPATGAVVDLDSARTAGRDEAAEIVDLCKLAGKDGLAAAFLKDGVSKDAVSAKLLALRATEDQGKTSGLHGGTASPQGEAPKISAAAIYADRRRQATAGRGTGTSS